MIITAMGLKTMYCSNPFWGFSKSFFETFYERKISNEIYVINHQMRVEHNKWGQLYPFLSFGVGEIDQGLGVKNDSSLLV